MVLLPAHITDLPPVNVHIVQQYGYPKGISQWLTTVPDAARIYKDDKLYICDIVSLAHVRNPERIFFEH